MQLNKSQARKFNAYTIIAVYFLILVGGIVRSAGAGMGCPDWPKCFGSYIPPASVEELPENYEELYVEARVKKNTRLASVLEGIGFSDLAERVETDPSIFVTTQFDPVKARVEYFNRLVGVTIGIFVILNMIFSFSYREENAWIPWLALISFLLVVFQGWVGSLVVSTNLLPGFITFHMMLALLLVALLMVQMFIMDRSKQLPVKGKVWISILLVLLTVQVVLGTQVREQIDIIKSAGIERSGWLQNLGNLFYIHRSFSILLVLIMGVLLYNNYKSGVFDKGVIGLAVVLLLEILLGVTMTWFSFPAFAQPAHLLLGTIAFGAIFYLFLRSNFITKRV